MVHTLNMSIFPKATDASSVKTKDSAKVALMQAVVLVVVIVAQLFTFEDFLSIFVDMHLASDATTYLVASSLVSAEVFSLPFLLRLKLSPAMRVFSMLLLWIVSVSWFAIGVILPITEPGMSTSGLLGSLVDVKPGYPLIISSILFGLLTAWSTWGLWPFNHKKKRSL